VPPGAPALSGVWIVVAVVGIATIAFKAAGPVVIGRRELPPRVQSFVELLAPVMLVALVVTQTFGGDQEIDARVVGVGAGAVAIVLRAHIIVAMAIAALVTALVRLAV
jgi:branched chain amino acid efflux pump